MKNLKKVLIGLAFIIIGVLWGLNSNGIINIGSLFFDGWWALFIIVPCFIDFITSRDKIGNLIGIGIGVLIILTAQDIISFSTIWKWFLPGVLIFIGLNISFYGLRKNTVTEKVKEIENSGDKIIKSSAIFSEEKIEEKEEFEAANLDAVFGSVKLDLRNAQIKQNAVISATAFFGEINIMLPNNVKTKIVSNSIFGSVEEKRFRESEKEDITVHIDGKTLFGGIKVK